MFSYIYADGRGHVNYLIGATTKAGIETLALDYISNMIRGDVGYAPVGAPPPAKEIQDVLNACAKQDAYKAIEAWNAYAMVILKHSVSCHKIEQFSIIE
jgi:hypothetical protein